MTVPTVGGHPIRLPDLDIFNPGAGGVVAPSIIGTMLATFAGAAGTIRPPPSA